MNDLKVRSYHVLFIYRLGGHRPSCAVKGHELRYCEIVKVTPKTVTAYLLDPLWSDIDPLPTGSLYTFKKDAKYPNVFVFDDVQEAKVNKVYKDAMQSYVNKLSKEKEVNNV